MAEEKPSFRKNLQDFFDSDTIGRKFWDMFIYGLIFLSIIQLMGEHGMLTWNLTHEQNIALDLVIASIFSVDYIARFYAAPKRVKYFFNIFSLIDLIAIIPSFIGFSQAQVLRSLRVFRAFRFLRIIKLIRALDIKDDFQKLKKSEAFEEVAFYDKLLGWYQQNIKKDNSVDTNGLKSLSLLIKEIQQITVATNQKIESGSVEMAGDKQTFYISFFELADQAKTVLEDFSEEATKLNVLKLKYLIRDIGLLLSAEHTTGEVKQLGGDAINRDWQFLMLIKVSLKDILSTASVAVALNVLILLTPLHKMIGSAVGFLPYIESAMAALIVFITSFNMSYTNTKRGNTDLALIEFTNWLTIYSEKLARIISEHEKGPTQKKLALKKIAHYFDCIGIDILNGTREGNKYRLKFDTAIIQSFDRIKSIISPYLKHIDEIERNQLFEIQDNLTSSLNKFQTLSTIRAAIIFNALNHWTIRVTYFVLMAISPLAAVPRLFIVNLMQRAFYKTANETDNAIFNTSLAKLPIEDRVLRRLCRIGSILR
jgi:hypothetical protein